MGNLNIEKFDEDYQLDYGFEDDLAYAEIVDKSGKPQEDILLYHKGTAVSILPVWCDAEEDERDYVLINHTVHYLDDLTRRKDVSKDNL